MTVDPLQVRFDKWVYANRDDFKNPFQIESEIDSLNKVIKQFSGDQWNERTERDFASRQIAYLQEKISAFKDVPKTKEAAIKDAEAMVKRYEDDWKSGWQSDHSDQQNAAVSQAKFNMTVAQTKLGENPNDPDALAEFAYNQKLYNSLMGWDKTIEEQRRVVERKEIDMNDKKRKALERKDVFEEYSWLIYSGIFVAGLIVVTIVYRKFKS